MSSVALSVEKGLTMVRHPKPPADIQTVLKEGYNWEPNMTRDMQSTSNIFFIV